VKLVNPTSSGLKHGLVAYPDFHWVNQFWFGNFNPLEKYISQIGFIFPKETTTLESKVGVEKSARQIGSFPFIFPIRGAN